MSKLDIPESWAEATVLDLVYSRGRIGWKGLKAEEYKREGPSFVSVREFNRDGSIRWDDCVHISQARYDESPEIMLKNDDILLCKDGSTIGKVAYVSDLNVQATINSSIALISPYHGMIPKFLFYYFKGPEFQRLVQSRIMGAAIPHIFQKDLRTLQIFVPPTKEQKRIVQKIESNQAKIDVIESCTKRAGELIEKYRGALLQKAFRGGLVPQDSNDEPASKLLVRLRVERAQKSDGKKKQTNELPPVKPEEVPFEIPKSWEWVRLGEICSKIGSGSTPKGGNSSYKSEGIPFIRSQNVLNGFLSLSDVAFIESKMDEEMKNSRVYPLDVLYNITGGSIGRSCVVPINFKHGNVNQHVLSIRPIYRDEDLSNYISMFLLSPYGKDFIFKNKKGAARDAITKGQIENLIFPLPPMGEVKRISFAIKKQAGLTEKLQENVKNLLDIKDFLSRSILSNAFSGKIVPQDLSEGTGHELLAKIKSDTPQVIEAKAVKGDSAMKMKRIKK